MRTREKIISQKKNVLKTHVHVNTPNSYIKYLWLVDDKIVQFLVRLNNNNTIVNAEYIEKNDKHFNLRPLIVVVVAINYVAD